MTIVRFSVLEPFTNWRFPSLVAVFGLIALLALNDVLVYTPDSARYLLWAKSLVQLRGFEDLSIHEPFHYVVHAPLYSVLLIPSALVAPDSVIAAKIMTALWGVGLILAFFLWLQRLTGNMEGGLLGSAILALHPLMILYSNQILSDVPFAVTLVLTLIAVGRMGPEAPGESRSFWMLSLILSAAILLREVGITLLLAVVVYFLARRQIRQALTVPLVPLALYLAWFVRNEILVAGTEFPPLRNSEIFTLHYFTDRSAPFVSELLARLQVNLPVYLDYVSRLVFFPQYGTAPYGVVNVTQPPVSLAASLYPVLHLPLALVTVVAAAYGLITAIRKNRASGLVLAFVPIYVLLILFYPFNDVRFMFPFALIMIAYGTLGVVEGLDVLRGRIHRSLRTPTMVLLAVFLIPNTAWCFAFVRDNALYWRSPREFYAAVKDSRPFPDLLTKPMRLIGDWIVSQGAESVTVLTQWKELKFWLPNGKLAEVNTLAPLDEFERQIRDYRVNYVVSATGLADLPEFFAQMQLSTSYHFVSVFRVANLEVFRVEESSRQDPEPDEGLRARFALGLRALSEGRIDSAGAVFQALADSTGGASTLVLFLAIAHEFRGDLQKARELLTPLQAMRQSGAFLGHAAYHLQIIDLLERASVEKNATARAELLYVVSVKYWNLGFHSQSLDALMQSLEADSLFSPALIFGTYYSLELGKRREAWKHLKSLQISAPAHPLISPFRRILVYTDSIASSGTPRVTQYLVLASAYEEAGLGDSAIRELLQLLKHHKQNLEARRALAALYIGKRRYYPALRTVEEWLIIDPADKEALALKEKLEKRW